MPKGVIKNTRYSDFSQISESSNVELTEVHWKKHPVTGDVFFTYHNDSLNDSIIVKIDLLNNKTVKTIDPLTPDGKTASLGISYNGSLVLAIAPTAFGNYKLYNTIDMSVNKSGQSLLSQQNVRNVIHKGGESPIWYVIGQSTLQALNIGSSPERIYSISTAAVQGYVCSNKKIHLLLTNGNIETLIDTESSFVSEQIIAITAGIPKDIICLSNKLVGLYSDKIITVNFDGTNLVEKLMIDDNITEPSTLQSDSSDNIYFSGIKDGDNKIFQLNANNTISIKKNGYRAYGFSDARQLGIINGEE